MVNCRLNSNGARPRFDSMPQHRKQYQVCREGPDTRLEDITRTHLAACGSRLGGDVPAIRPERPLLLPHLLGGDAEELYRAEGGYLKRTCSRLIS